MREDADLSLVRPGADVGAGRVTHPADVPLAQPAAPATVQSQIRTVCCGTLLVSATQVVPVVLPQFLPL